MDVVINEQHLKDHGFKKIQGLHNYMIKDQEVRSILTCKKISVRHDGRLNITDNRGVRTTCKIQHLRSEDE